MDGRDLDEPAVAEENAEYPFGVGAEAGIDRGRSVGAPERLERLPEALGTQHVGLAVLVDETGVGEAGEGFRRPAQIEAGGRGDLGDGRWAGAEDEGSDGSETVFVGQQAEEGGGFGGHGRRPGYWDGHRGWSATRTARRCKMPHPGV